MSIFPTTRANVFPYSLLSCRMNFPLAILFATLAVAVCGRSLGEEPQAAEPQATSPSPTAGVGADVGRPAENPTGEALSEKTPDTAAPTVAKPKTYFLLQRVSIPVEGGLKGLQPGTRLRLLDDSGIKWKLTDGANLVEVEPALLTTDEETAKAMLISDQKAREAALAARMKAMKEAEAMTAAERERHSKAVQAAAIPEKAGLTGESRLLDNKR